jgi:hypothetical protein
VYAADGANEPSGLTLTPWRVTPEVAERSGPEAPPVNWVLLGSVAELAVWGSHAVGWRFWVRALLKTTQFEAAGRCLDRVGSDVERFSRDLRIDESTLAGQDEEENAVELGPRRRRCHCRRWACIPVRRRQRGSRNQRRHPGPS